MRTLCSYCHTLEKSQCFQNQHLQVQVEAPAALYFPSAQGVQEVDDPPAENVPGRHAENKSVRFKHIMRALAFRVSCCSAFCAHELA